VTFQHDKLFLFLFLQSQCYPLQLDILHHVCVGAVHVLEQQE
ncbi:uncharacterized protein METZ01_LOCUS430875, partial [marine metagenome]